MALNRSIYVSNLICRFGKGLFQWTRRAVKYENARNLKQDIFRMKKEDLINTKNRKETAKTFKMRDPPSSVRRLSDELILSMSDWLDIG